MPAESEPSAPPAADPFSWLNKAEKYALGVFLDNRQKSGSRYAPIAPTTAAQLFQLYLTGRTIREIWNANQQFSLGQVVHAAVEGGWEDQRIMHVQTTIARARARAEQVTAEGLDFVGDMLTAAHRLHGDALRRFIQTGDPSDLGAFGIASPKQYKDAIELFQKLSGADKVQKVQGTMKHEHSHTIKTVPTAPPPPDVPASALSFLSAAGAEELAKQKAQEE